MSSGHLLIIDDEPPIAAVLERIGEARGLKMGGIIAKPFRVAEIRAMLTELIHPS